MHAQKGAETGATGKVHKYNQYTAEERVQISKYVAEHGPVKAVRNCSELLGRQVPIFNAIRYCQNCQDELVIWIFS